MLRVWDFVSTYSLLMIAGVLIALAWTNIDPAGHHALVDRAVWDHAPVGHPRRAPDGSVAHRS